MVTEWQNNNVDIQAQDLKSLDLNEIKKLFDKIPKEYLDTLDIDKDGNFDEQDIQKIISWDIDPNSILGKEIKAKQEALSIKLLKEIVDNISIKLNKNNSKKLKKLNINFSNNMTKIDERNSNYWIDMTSLKLIWNMDWLQSYVNNHTEISNEKIKKEEAILSKILEKYSNNIDNLLITNTKEAKQDIKKILDLYIINNSDCMSFTNNNYIEIKNKLLKNLNFDLVKKLNWYKFENWKEINVEEIFTKGNCNTENLIKKLSEIKWPNWEKLSIEEIQDIIFWVATIKEDKSLKTLKGIFIEYNLTLDSFKSKDSNWILTIFKEKNIPKEQQKVILKELVNLWNINKAKNIDKKEIENIQNLLQRTNNAYNKSYSNEYFLKKENRNDIKKITDIDRIIELFKYFKEKGKTYKYLWINMLNTNIQTNFDVLINYSKIFKKKLNYLDIKNINLSFLNINKNLSLRNAENITNLNTLLKHIENTTLYFFYLNNKNLYKFLSDDNKKIINNLEAKYKKNSDINKININNFDEIFKYIDNEEDNIKIDNFLHKLIKEKWINILFKKENWNRIIDLLFIDRLPKTANYIIKENKIEEVLEKDPIYTYEILPITYQKKYALKYTNLIIDKYNNKKIEGISNLEKIQFPDLKESIKIFNKIKEYLPALLKSSIFRYNFSQFQEELQQKWIDNEINKLNSKEKKEFTEFRKYFKKEFENYNKNIDSEYKKEYETKIVRTIKNNEIIENNKKYIERFQNEFWSTSSNLNQLFSMFNKWIKNKEKTETADITTIFHNLMEKSLKHDDISKELNQLRKLVDLKHYKKILSELEKRIEETSKILNSKSSVKINEFIKGNPNDKKFLDKLWLIIDNWEFWEKAIKKLEWIYKKYLKKYYEKQLEDIKKNWWKIDENKIEKNAINKLLWNANISDKLKNELLSIIKNTNVNQYIKNINKTYNNDYAYSASDEEFNALSNQLENNYFSWIINDVEEYEKENWEINLPTENQQNNESSNKININSFYSDWENNYTIKVNWEELTWLTQDEINDIWIKKDEKWNIIVENKEALKNLINMKETLESIWLDFAWKYRNELIWIMKSTHWFMWMEMNLKDDLINKTELNNYLKFIISLIGLQPDLTLNWNKNILRTYNWYSETNKNKNALKGWLWKVWEKFINMWFLTTDWTLQTNWQTNINHYISNNLNKKIEWNTTT